jgi:hypothetical protein
VITGLCGDTDNEHSSRSFECKEEGEETLLCPVLSKMPDRAQLILDISSPNEHPATGGSAKNAGS